MNKFGGQWTENKIEILVEYAKAYLQIMNFHANKYGWKLLYFDGFAGSGFIKKGKEENQKLIVGAAARILEINDPRPFDLYYFVEKKKMNAASLETYTAENFPNKDVKIVATDGNEKILSMAKWLSGKGKQYRTLAYIDPCGMQVNWASLQALEKLPVDVWILVPTGMGVNRVLQRDGKISDEWVERLESFLGMNKSEIMDFFYKEQHQHTLFEGIEIQTTKKHKAIEKSAELYQNRLKTLFKYVSEPFVLRNSTSAIMFHFFMVSNNQNANKIANDIIKKYNTKA